MRGFMAELPDKRKRCAVGAFSTLVVLGGVALLEHASRGQRGVAGLFDRIRHERGIVVQFVIDDRFFPEDWKTGQIRAEATPIDRSELRRFPAILAAELAKYPRRFLAANLRRVCLARGLRFYGQWFGGTNSRDTIYLTSSGRADGYTDRYLREMVHHELSSIFMRNYPFPSGNWKRCNAPGFSYGEGGVRAIERGETGFEGNAELYPIGLLSEYSKSDLEEDFNTYCETLFTDPERLERLAERYPRVRRKYELCREFFASLGVEAPR